MSGKVENAAVECPEVMCLGRSLLTVNCDTACRPRFQVEIYLNPDNVELFQESADAKGDNSEQVNSAEKLLADLLHLNEPQLALKVATLEAYVQMASKNKAKI